MPNKLFYTVLPVGQGSGTLVQVVDATTHALLETSLIDLGSLGWSDDAGKPSADFVIAELKKMATPRLSGLFLSHSDSDHTNLLGRVLDAFDTPSEPTPKKPVLTIERVWYGGAYAHYTKYHKSILDRIVTYRPTTAKTNLNDLNAGATSWANSPPSPLLTTANGVQFWLLYGNAATAGMIFEDAEPERKASRAYLRNVASLVLVVRYGSKTVHNLVATGDATGLTLASCNNVFQAIDTGLSRVLTLSLPHHGSQVTTYDMLGMQTDDLDRAALVKEVLDQFIDVVRPWSITASAGEDHHHRHPASRVIQDFGGHLAEAAYVDAGAGAKQHFYTGYYALDTLKLTGSSTTTTWPPTTDWYTARTPENVFTIDYFHGDPATVNAPVAFPPDAAVSTAALPYTPAPPRAAGWLFAVTDDGARVDIHRVVDRHFTAVRTMARLEDVHGPLPEERFVRVPSAAAEEEARALQGATPAARASRTPAVVPTPAGAQLGSASPHRGAPRLRQIP